MNDNAFADAASPKAALERAARTARPSGPANVTVAHPADRSAAHASSMPGAPTGALSRGGRVIAAAPPRLRPLPR